MTTKKKSSVKKATSAKTKKAPAKRPLAKVKKTTAKKTSEKHLEDVVTKQALKLVDEAATLLRHGIKASQKNTTKARETAHKKAHTLLGQATRHLDEALKSSSSFLRKAINKL